MKTTFSVRDSVEATVVKNTDNGDAIRITGHVRAECYGPDGKLKWMEEGPNVIATTGLDYILNTDLAAASNFVGLLGAGTPVAGWTMTEAGGSTGAVSDTNGDREIHGEYSDGTRPAWTVVDSTAQSVTNAASVATFNINGTATVTGAFLTTVSTKNDQTGTLIAAKLFGASKAVSNGDTLQVTYAIDAA